MDQTTNLDAPSIFRRWTAISLIAASLEQKAWIMTSAPMYPNLYVFLIGHPGVGKSRTISVGRSIIRKIPEFHLAPISMTFASLVDSLVLAKRTCTTDDPATPKSFNSMLICADELGAFMHKYDNEMIDGLAAFYDVTPYQQTRRTMEVKIEIDEPQINLLAGSTPQNLLQFMPEKAWGQGFSSRIIMVFSDERIVGDDFAPRDPLKLHDLEHDIKIINNLYGQFHVTEEYRQCINNWRQLGEPPVPDHPKLVHYITRRKAHLYKLSMVSSVDRGNSLCLTRDDFNRALNWLVEAEAFMPEIFKAGATNVDGQAMEEIYHFVMASDRGSGVDERKIIHFAHKRVPIHSILRIIEIMERSGQLFLKGTDRRTGLKYYTVIDPSSPAAAGSSVQSELLDSLSKH
jgi:hypothetical protein